MKKQNISSLLRKLKLLYFVDWMRFYWQKFKNRKINRKFIIENPTVKLPPDYLIYESFRINYLRYYTKSKDSAVEIVNHFKKYIDI